MTRPTDAQREQWREEGFVVLENAMVGDDLRRLQAAFDRCAAEARPGWLERVEAGVHSAMYFDIPDPLEQDEVFVDLADHPSWYGFLMDFCGDDLIFLAPQVRTVPPSPISYIGWHPDVPHTTPLHMKVQIYLNDVGPGEGGFAYVPGSHRKGAGPYPAVHRIDSMPGHRVFTGKAGTAILFNSYGMHTAVENRTPVPRKSIILIYEKWSRERFNPQRFAAIAPLCATRARRKLFGMEV